MIINTIVQARMGSTRFPGKVMAEVAGKPLIGHLLDRIVGADVNQTIVAMPISEADEPLFDYVDRRNDVWYVASAIEEEDVAGRFGKVLKEIPCDAFVRVCADSPFLTAEHINDVADLLRSGINFVPPLNKTPGLQAEGVQTKHFLEHIDQFDAYDREHVTTFFKKRMSLTVDTPEDLERLRPLLEAECLTLS